MKKFFIALIAVSAIASQALALLTPFKQLTPFQDSLISQFSPDGLKIFVQTDKEASIMDLNGQRTFTIKTDNFDEYTGSVGFNGCGDLIAISTDPYVDGTGSVRIYDRPTGNQLFYFKPTEARAYGRLKRVQFSEDCAKLFMYSEGPLFEYGEWYAFARIFDIRTGKTIFSKDFAGRTDLMFISDDFTKLALSNWGKMTFVDVASGDEFFHYESTDTSDGQGLFYPNAEHFVLLEEQGLVHLNLRLQTIEHTVPAPELISENQFTQHPEKSKLVVHSNYDGNKVFFYDLDTRTFQSFDTGFTESVDRTCISAKGNRVIAINREDAPSVIDTTNNTILERLSLEPDRVQNCAINPDGTLAIIGGQYLGSRLYKLGAK